ncbi:MAG: hypothetical protein OEY29_09215 [Gammaproteobacteria bacterium]|nr:hypothetical protein [Gammaproteobacteria bacterium]
MLYFILGVLVSLLVITILSVIFPSTVLFEWVKLNISNIQAAGSLAIASSAVVAFFLYRATIKRHKKEDADKSSEYFLKEGKELLEKTYQLFTDDGENKSPPRNDRLLWLTTARMIIRYQNLKSKITANAHLEIIEEHEEYWRFHFYKLLDENSANFSIRYFQPSGDRYNGFNVARNSIAIIFDFAKWNGPDPLEGVDDKRLFAKKVVSIDQHGIEHYLEQYEGYWADVMEIRRNEYNDI